MIDVAEFVNSYIRPRVQGDGGDIVFESLTGNDLTLTLLGECAVCHKSCDMAEWVREALQLEYNQDFNIVLKSKRRYFQDV